MKRIILPLVFASTLVVSGKEVEPQHRVEVIAAYKADAAEKLKASVGGEWRVAKSERFPGVGRELWCEFTTWYGVSVAYAVLPFSSSDGPGQSKLKSFRARCSAALDVIASDDRWTVLAGVCHEADVTSKVLQALDMKMSKEAEKRQQMAARGNWLDFRLAVAKRNLFNRIIRSGPKSHDKLPSSSQISDYRKLMDRKGPNGGRHRGDPYQWFWKLDMCNSSTAIVRTKSRHGTEYLLLSNKPEEVLLNGSACPRPWYLKRVYKTANKKGRFSITLELDESSTLRLSKLVKDREGWPLAVLFDNSIMVLVRNAHEKPNGRIVLTGGNKGFDIKTAEKIISSLSACMLRERKTGGNYGRDKVAEKTMVIKDCRQTYYY